MTSQATDYLLWIGCSVTYEERAQRIARAMVRILDKAGVSYGILEESRCTGDPAKQMGNEFLFSELAQMNIEEFDALGVKKIITLCPHCYNSFSRHYPPLGGHYTLIPHVVFIDRLIAQGKIRLRNRLEPARPSPTMTRVIWGDGITDFQSAAPGDRPGRTTGGDAEKRSGQLLLWRGRWELLGRGGR